MKYDKYGRPRNRIYGHWDNLFETPTRNAILKILNNGQKKAKMINKIMGKSVYSHLAYLVNIGLIKRVKHGIYALNKG